MQFAMHINTSSCLIIILHESSQVMELPLWPANNTGDSLIPNISGNETTMAILYPQLPLIFRSYQDYHGDGKKLI